MTVKRLLAFSTAVILMCGCGVLEGAESDHNLFDTRLGLDVGSAYIFRGATMNDGWVLQPSAEVSAFGLFAGAWANYDLNDYSGILDRFRFTEERIYGGYRAGAWGFQIKLGYTYYLERLSHTAVDEAPIDLSRLTLPEIQEIRKSIKREAMSDQYPVFESDDASEGVFELSYPARWTPSLSVYHGLDGSLEDMTYVIAGLDFRYYDRAGWRMSMGGSFAYYDGPDQDGMSYCVITHAVSYGYLRAEIRFIGNFDEDLLPDAEDGGPYDIREYALIGLSRHF